MVEDSLSVLFSLSTPGFKPELDAACLPIAIAKWLVA